MTRQHLSQRVGSGATAQQRDERCGDPREPGDSENTADRPERPEVLRVTDQFRRARQRESDARDRQSQDDDAEQRPPVPPRGDYRERSAHREQHDLHEIQYWYYI